MTTQRMLAVLVLLAACRSTAGGGGLGPEEDAGTETDVVAVDSGMTTPTDATTGMDRRCVPSGMENSNAACSDGIDNDCNGFFDCNDFACSRNAAVTICPDAGQSTRDAAQRVDTAGCVRSGGEDDAMACGDGRDNDCNGFMDCNDFACSRNPAVMVCGAFDAGAPRDVFMFRDVGPRGDSAGCTSMGMENTPTACADGIDNDCDGFLDCADRNCSCQGTCPGAVVGCTCQGNENTNTACGDGVDNDCNSFVDCRDFSCSRNTSVNVCPDAGM